MHLQSPWLLRSELIIDRKLTMHCVAGRIQESFKTDLFVIWNEDNSEKLTIRCRVYGAPDKDDDEESGAIEEAIFLRQLEKTMLDFVGIRGLKGINRVFLTEQDKVTISSVGYRAFRQGEGTGPGNGQY